MHLFHKSQPQPTKHPEFSTAHLKAQKPEIPQPNHDTTSIPQRLPPRVLQTKYHSHPMTFYHPDGHTHSVLRDLGFTGVLSDRIIWTWGDTLMSTPEGPRICAVGSTSIGTIDEPMSALDSALTADRKSVRNWIACTDEEEKDGGLTKYAFGGTNIVEIEKGKGLVYYLKNYRPEGKDQIQGAGIARCWIDDDSGHGNVPRSERVGTTIWSSAEPCWGDIGVVCNAADGYVYAFGHGPAGDEELNARGYLCRALGRSATDVNAYEYFLAQSGQWTKQRQANGLMGTGMLRKEDAVFGWRVMNQSVPFWSRWFGVWMVLHTSEWMESDILCRTAETLEGPWTERGSVASTKRQTEDVENIEGEEGELTYCGTAHPEFDPSGKTVLVTWTRGNRIWGVTIEWE